MKKITLFFLIAINVCCEKSKNVEIINKDLKNHITTFIKEIETSKECQSKYITVEINSDKIYISNIEPFKSKNFLGFTKLNESFVYFYSSANYSSFISINNNDFKPLEKNYSNECDPSKYKILTRNPKNNSILKLLKFTQ